MREDILAAPLFAMSFKDGASIAMLDPAPRGNTTEEESKLTNLVMTDARFQFGAMGAWQAEDGTVQFGFRYPGTVNDFGGARGATCSTAVDSTVSPDYRGLRRELSNRRFASVRMSRFGT